MFGRTFEWSAGRQLLIGCIQSGEYAADFSHENLFSCVIVCFNYHLANPAVVLFQFKSTASTICSKSNEWFNFQPVLRLWFGGLGGKNLHCPIDGAKHFNSLLWPAS